MGTKEICQLKDIGNPGLNPGPEKNISETIDEIVIRSVVEYQC